MVEDAARDLLCGSLRALGVPDSMIARYRLAVTLDEVAEMVSLKRRLVEQAEESLEVLKGVCEGPAAGSQG